jgi:hypothetical protein
MKVQTVSSHSLLWYIVLLGMLVVALVVVLSRSAADVPPTVSVDSGASTSPGTAMPSVERR